MTSEQFKAMFPRASRSCIEANADPEPNRLEKAPEQQRDPEHEPVAKDAREGVDQVRRRVRITSYRRRLCDERNLFDKHVSDSLVTAGILYDDSREWCEIEVAQEQVTKPEEERTEIEIYQL